MDFLLACLLLILFLILIRLFSFNKKFKIYKMWKEWLKEKPTELAFWLTLAAMVSLVILWVLFVGSGTKSNFITDDLAPLSVIAGLIVLLLSIWGFIHNSASLNHLKNEIIGSHELFETFEQHINKLHNKVFYTTNGNLVDMTLVVSSLAYGIQSGNTKHAEKFLEIINKYLDDIGSIKGNKNLKLFLWDRETHKIFFGKKYKQDEATTFICNELKNTLNRIKNMAEKNKFSFKAYSTRQLDWRLFLYEKENENFGMTVLFTPLDNKSEMKDGDWAMSSYSSNSSGIDKHFTDFIDSLQSNGAEDITSEILDVDNYIKGWFEVNC